MGQTGIRHLSGSLAAVVCYELAQSLDAAVESLLAQTASRAKVLVNPEDFASIGQRNNCTPTNYIENLRTAHSTGQPLNRKAFRETLNGTWDERYHAVLAKHPEARHVYSAIALL